MYICSSDSYCTLSFSYDDNYMYVTLLSVVPMYEVCIIIPSYIPSATGVGRQHEIRGGAASYYFVHWPITYIGRGCQPCRSSYKSSMIPVTIN